MIYNQKQATFVALAGLLTSATAAPAHHAKNGHTSELIAPGEKPVDLAGRIDKDKYPPACHEAWELFTQGTCWCFTGCALDCSDGRSPGSPGKTMHPEWCKDVTADDQTACEELACDLVENCKDVSAELAPGLDKIVSTGGYTCPNPESLGVAAASDFWLSPTTENLKWWCAQVADPLPDMFPPVTDMGAWEASKFEFFLDGKKLDLPDKKNSLTYYPMKYFHLDEQGTLFCMDNLSEDETASAWATIFGTKPDNHLSWFSSTDEGKALIPRITIAVTK